MTTPTWALTLAYWFHLLATVVWIGGLATLALLILPLAQRQVDQATFARFLDRHRGETTDADAVIEAVPVLLKSVVATVASST